MELHFDEMNVDTTLAQAYLKKENLSGVWETTKTPYFDGKTFCNSFDYKLKKEYPNLSDNFQNLSVLLTENVNLFAQLEYLSRKIPIEDTKPQINLIIQQINYLSNYFASNHIVAKTIDSEHFSMSNETPLLYLGFVVRAIAYMDGTPTIVASKETTAICFLFTKLCHEAGFAVVTRFGDDTVEDHAGNEICGTVGVVSENSDIDSAVDVFLTSSKQVPWRLRRILVQESVYTQVKDALTWKCNLNNPGKSTSDILHYNGRVFLIDAVDNSNPQPTEVAVEPYRTRKELLSLLNQYRPHYLSLWANDISEINEVAHGILSQVVWVNNFADFRGPPKISEAIYSIRSLLKISNEILSKAVVDELTLLRSSWLKLNNQTRCEILYNTLVKIADEQPDNEFYSRLKRTYRTALISSDTFVDVGQDYVCIGLPVASDKIYLCARTDNVSFSESLFKSILRGNAFIFLDATPEVLVLIDSLKKAGVPVLNELRQLGDRKKNVCHKFYVLSDFDQITRVIWTNSGTIFAN